MGSSTSRSRRNGKVRRSSGPPSAGPRTTTDGDPPIMWPGAGSGFEADPMSPAGTAERMWQLTGRVGGGRHADGAPAKARPPGKLARLVYRMLGGGKLPD